MVRLENRLDAQVQAMFHDRLPDGCPSDLLEKQAYLRALALLALLNGEGARVGRPEIIVVEDHTHPHADGSPTVDWGLPVDSHCYRNVHKGINPCRQVVCNNTTSPKGTALRIVRRARYKNHNL